MARAVAPGSRWERPSLSFAERIYGLETEYLVAFLPEAGGVSPPFDLVADLVERSIPDVAKACRSGHAKGGYFLENGSYVHFELYLRERADTPILEIASPECRSPADIVRYYRAQDLFLRSLARRVEGSLRRRGYAGKVVFGKTNRDRLGCGLGLHENYLVEDPLSPARMIGLALAVAGLATAYAPILIPLGAFAAFAGLPPLGARVLGTGARLAGRATRAVWGISRPAPFFLAVPALLASGAAWMSLRSLGSLLELAAAGIGAAVLAGRATWRILAPRIRGLARFVAIQALTGLLAIPVILYARALRRLLFLPFLRDLTPFLVTRPILGGTGHLSLESAPPPLELSQRAGLLAGLAGISAVRGRKYIFDLKQFLYRPLDVFRKRKRLTIASGDAPMIDSGLFVSLGATALAIEMIERGETFPSLRVRDPIAAIRGVSRGGPLARITALDGLTAIEVQRAYLARAQAFFARCPEGSPERAVLDLWARLLGILADRPDLARDTIDWCAKKTLLDAVVLPASSWRSFMAWGGVLELIERNARPGWEDRDLESVLAGLARGVRSRARRMLRERGLDPRRYARAREVYLHARKIEFRYHEVSRDGGYHGMLEEGAEVRRLTGKEEVERALRLPPRGTRAWARGALVKESRSAVDLEVRWDRVLAEHGSVVIPLADPFSEAIPARRRRNRGGGRG